MTTAPDFWREYKTRLRNYIAKRVQDHSAADDILQEVLLKAHTSLHTVKAQGNIAAWLYRIAANSITDHYRSQRHWDELTDEFTAPEPERDYVAELANCLRPLIAGLPDTFQAALILSELEGLPQKEVAKRLGISLSGAKSRIQRGREKLRQRLLDCCDVEMAGGDIIGYEQRGNACDNGCD